MQIHSMKSLSKSFYLQCVKQASKFTANKHDKVVFMLSFPSTSEYVLDKLYERYQNRLVICYTKNAQAMAINYQTKGCQVYPLDSFDVLLRKVVPTLKNSKVIVCDNYFAVLGGIDFLASTKIIQIWHANGAIKKFGLEANYAKNATQIDQKRYQEVYARYTHYVVSSQHMADIFAQSYHTAIEVLPFGYPLTDRYFNLRIKEQVMKKYLEDNPKQRKIALYVPTYREHNQENPIDIDYMQQALGDDWYFILHPHPHDHMLKKKIAENRNQTSNLDHWPLSDLLFVADCLITDYSSVPFEYSLANPAGKTIYFCYDLNEYNETVGVQESFVEETSKKRVDSNEALAKEVLTTSHEDSTDFNTKWNAFADGHAVKQLIDWIDKQYAN
ncbi:CDP-glycerol glycerophosphotransferase family protein [Enterococcus sp.]|nr:CDP-glycerol glycerophosphotransferase family protein [Enterococcus sp.]